MVIAMTKGYSEQTAGAKLCIDLASDWAGECIADLNIEDNLFLMDYGAADGGTASEFWGKIIKDIQERKTTSQISLIGNDLYSNDNQALINNLSLHSSRQESVSTLMCAGSFYDQLVPNGFIDFGFSATAMHWLNKKVETLDDHTHVLASDNKRARNDFLKQALFDWNQILEMRSKELKVGGKLLTVNLSRDYEDRYLGNNGGKTVNVHDQIHSIWKELRDENLITEIEYRNGTIQNFYKSPEEFTSPLTNVDSASYKNGLRLLKERTVYVGCPYKEKWRKTQNTEEFSIGLMETIRSWSRHSFAAALDQNNSRNVNPVDILFDRLTSRIKSDPENWSLDYVEHHLMMEKV
ncbi:Hypothetical protein P9215_04061 [Prochlorococcus marinus str. MIT 9215]|uniref:SAM dependent carboxyl methyltransferase n=1 Tax=Prochlorococcus marinus (strain MIT 9215) TaxID=93060 RepID=A8G341_PROM2|nr:hypothetical protein [Prochlorococcus marinus]ABV50022.1 Hypothetical protein P9215_04061 [Prochlorococcus marinus str. MIT 9215]